MKTYIGCKDYMHGDQEATGILVANLGSPDAPTAPALRRYLAEFLWDPRVVEMSRPLWWMILHGIILRTRPKRSARAYQSIWGPEGSPLLKISKKQCAALEERIKSRFSGPVSAALGMRYGNPSIAFALERLREAGCTRLLILPLYPQYSGSTTGSTFDAVASVLTSWRWVPEIRFINHYHDTPEYIDALAGSIQRHWDANGRLDMLLFSFHGIPKRYMHGGDPYHCHCHKTARLTAKKLNLKEKEWQVSFQSRFGREEWIQPYTDATLKNLPKAGIKSVNVVCPGFSADCLETIEEIGVENRAYFRENGGEEYSYIPALNDNADHIGALEALVVEHAGNWCNLVISDAELEKRRERSIKLGANS